MNQPQKHRKERRTHACDVISQATLSIGWPVGFPDGTGDVVSAIEASGLPILFFVVPCFSLHKLISLHKAAVPEMEDSEEHEGKMRSVSTIVKSMSIAEIRARRGDLVIMQAPVALGEKGLGSQAGGWPLREFSHL